MTNWLLSLVMHQLVCIISDAAMNNSLEVLTK